MNLRQMTMADADKMLEWKNYPETRQYAIVTHDEIKKEDHYRWLSQRLNEFQIAHDGEDIRGAVRINDNEISVWVDRKFWKMGTATWILQTIAKRGMTAKIVEGNVGSMVAFIRAGFEPISFNETYYIFKKW